MLEAWSEIEVLQHAAWLGPLLVAALQRQEGLAAHHLACLHLGAKNIPRERRWAPNRSDRLLASLDAIHGAALACLKEHDRLVVAKNQMERRLPERAGSKLSIGALATTSLHRHHPGQAKGFEAGGAQPRRSSSACAK